VCGGWTIVRFRSAHILSWFFNVSIVVGVAGQIVAQVPPLPLPRMLAPNEVQQQLELWEKKYQEILVDLHAGTSRSDKRARKQALALYQGVVDRAVSGEVLCRLAGRVLTLLGIAETRLGDRDAGAWHWQMAQNVSGELRGLDFHDFPDVAPFMKSSLIPEKRWEGVQHYLKGETVTHDAGRKDVVPPRITKKVPPSYPAGLSGQWIGGRTVVEAVIDEQGRVREPVVQRGCGHVSLDLAAMEALREWVYQPAIVEGKPVEVFLTVTVNFDRQH